MENQEEQNQGNTPEFKNNNKSALDRGMDIKNKAENAKGIWDKVKGMKAFAPIASVIGYIAVFLIIIFLIVGFVAFFITMPGLFFNKFIQACQGFWNSIVGDDETFTVNEEEVVNLANYIEDLGYDVEGFGFASIGTVERETSEDEEQEENHVGVRKKIKNFNFKKDALGYYELTQLQNLIAYIYANERTYTTQNTTTSFLDKFMSAFRSCKGKRKC